MRPFVLLVVLMTCCAARATAAELSLELYQRPDGAITTYLNGDTVDPYFAAKALLSAQDTHLDAHRAAAAWIRWLLPRQREDGGFDRFCWRGEQFLACAAADADDAMAAVWIELLVRFAPASGLPPSWRTSLAKADDLLSHLYDKGSGVYQISKSLPVALLMDNVEVLSTLAAVHDFYVHHGSQRTARLWGARADELRRNIMRTFWDPQVGFRVSTQERSAGEFYPDQVAQLFPILAGVEPPGVSNRSRYALWMEKNRSIWLRRTETDYPWGLVALIANTMGDRNTVLCWCGRAAPFRRSRNWNVLEEAIYLALTARVGAGEVPLACDQ